MKIKHIFLSLAAAMLLGAGALFASNPDTAHAEQIIGYFDAIRYDGTQYVAYGWAADRDNPDKQISIVLFDGTAARGSVIGHARTSLVREDVNRYLAEDSGVRRRGFYAPLDYSTQNLVHAYAVLSDGQLHLLGSVSVDVRPSEPVEPQPSEPNIEVSERDWVRGDLSKAKVVMVEYTDLQCPFCQRLHPSLVAIKENYGDDVAWVYRHFPLTSIHQHAESAALAAECAGEQTGDDGFFAYTDALFDNQQSLGTELYFRLAESMRGVDVARFESCFNERRYIDKIQAQYQTGLDKGVGATPTTFINDEPVVGAQPQSSFTTIIDRMLSETR